MRNRTRMIAAAVAAAAALTAGGTAAAMAATAGAASGAPAKTVSATATATATATVTATKKPGPSSKPGLPSEQQGHDALVAAVAEQLHVSQERVAAALAPLFAAGTVDPSSPAFAAAARSLGVSPQRLTAALVHAKESLGRGAPAPSPGGAKSKS